MEAERYPDEKDPHLAGLGREKGAECYPDG